MVTFRKTSPQELPVKARYYLEEAIRRTPASVSKLETFFTMAARGIGDIYLIEDGELIGCTYIVAYPTIDGKVLSPVLVGGQKLHRWRDDLHDFLVAELKRIDGEAIRFIARKGWVKKYPMCRNIGTIYEWKPGGH